MSTGKDKEGGYAVIIGSSLQGVPAGLQDDGQNV